MLKRHFFLILEIEVVIEALGSEANGPCANLAIEEISGNLYRIDEYDGTENVITPNGSDWIFINDPSTKENHP